MALAISLLLSLQAIPPAFKFIGAFFAPLFRRILQLVTKPIVTSCRIPIAVWMRIASMRFVLQSESEWEREIEEGEGAEQGQIQNHLLFASGRRSRPDANIDSHGGLHSSDLGKRCAKIA